MLGGGLPDPALRGGAADGRLGGVGREGDSVGAAEEDRLAFALVDDDGGTCEGALLLVKEETGVERGLEASQGTVVVLEVVEQGEKGLAQRFRKLVEEGAEVPGLKVKLSGEGVGLRLESGALLLQVVELLLLRLDVLLQLLELALQRRELVGCGLAVLRELLLLLLPGAQFVLFRLPQLDVLPGQTFQLVKRGFGRQQNAGQAQA